MRPRGKHKPFLSPKTGAGASPLSGYGPQHQHPHTNPMLLGCLGALPAIGDAQVPGAPALYQHQAGLCSGVREKHRSPSPTHSLGRAQMGPEGGGEQGGKDGRSRDFTNPINQVRNQPCKTHNTDGRRAGNPPLSSQWELGCKARLAGTATGKWHPLLRGQG